MPVDVLQLTSHGQNLETLYKSIPMRMMPDDYLPDEYDGPTVGSIKDVIGQCCCCKTNGRFTRVFCTPVGGLDDNAQLKCVCL